MLVVAARDPYRNARRALASLGPLADLTDLNYDLGPSWWLSLGEAVVNVRLSFVGPYALVLDSSGAPVEYDDVARVLDDGGFILLGSDVLARVVDIWAPEVVATVYEFLFEFDNGLPWA